MSAEVTREFDAGAARYDLLVGLNPGYHQHLLRCAGLGRTGAERPHAGRPGVRLGASTKALLGAFGDVVTIAGIDASGGMLDQARAKQWPAGVTFTQGRAGELASLLDEPVDGILAAYLLRNVPEGERDQVLADAFEALRPRGARTVLEYSVAGDALRAARIWRAVCETVILPLAIVTGGNHGLYRYLRTQRARVRLGAALRQTPARHWFHRGRKPHRAGLAGQWAFCT